VDGTVDAQLGRQILQAATLRPVSGNVEAGIVGACFGPGSYQYI
jgi:hypothetical protein